MVTGSGSCEARLGERLLGYLSEVEDIESSYEVLNRLHNITNSEIDLPVLGALLLPRKLGDWDAIVEGKTLFLHESAPKGWWEDYVEHSKKTPGPSLMTAYLALVPFTLSETLRALEPIGIDRWALEFTYRYGIRDTLACPIGGRWVIAFWSRTVLSKSLTQERRALVFIGATFAVNRLQKLLSAPARRLGRGTQLTARELSVLRMLSFGKRVKEIAEELELGEETIRTHIKKAQGKLEANSQSHAVAQAMREHLIA
ncbi:MAG: hypothetical protein RLZ98_3090 [Pseudomonadota bacterium]|jgi:LuxR family quorum sensing-dependent transcriptional regulator